jgi:hypothetical protein
MVPYNDLEQTQDGFKMPTYWGYMCVCVCYFIEKNCKKKKIGFIIDEQ